MPIFAIPWDGLPTNVSRTAIAAQSTFTVLAYLPITPPIQRRVDGRVLRRWRTRHPELFVHSAEQSAFNRLLRDVLPDVLDASVRCAVEDGAQGHQDRKLLLEMAGAYRAKAAPMLTSGVSVYLPDNHRG